MRLQEEENTPLILAGDFDLMRPVQETQPPAPNQWRERARMNVDTIAVRVGDALLLLVFSRSINN